MDNLETFDKLVHLVQLSKKLQKSNDYIKKTFPDEWDVMVEPFKSAIHTTMNMLKSSNVIEAMLVIRKKLDNPILILWLEATTYQMMKDKHNILCNEH